MHLHYFMRKLLKSYVIDGELQSNKPKNNIYMLYNEISY